VNWFRRGDDGKFLWPGYGDNSRVLAWICRRLEAEANGTETPIGVVPTADDLELDGLGEPRERVEDALRVDPAEWRDELPTMHEHFASFGDKLPPALRDELAALEHRLAAAD